MKFERLAIDSSAAIDFLDDKRTSPPQIREAAKLFLPFAVLGELEFGILNSSPERHAGAAEKFGELVADCELLLPDRETISQDAHIRVAVPFPPSISRRREIHLLNDLWIAALCVQHKLPLLSNDRDFDGIEGLEVIHW